MRSRPTTPTPRPTPQPSRCYPLAYCKHHFLLLACHAATLPRCHAAMLPPRCLHACHATSKPATLPPSLPRYLQACDATSTPATLPPSLRRYLQACHATSTPATLPSRCPSPIPPPSRGRGGLINAQHDANRAKRGGVVSKGKLGRNAQKSSRICFKAPGICPQKAPQSPTDSPQRTPQGPADSPQSSADFLTTRKPLKIASKKKTRAAIERRIPESRTAWTTPLVARSCACESDLSDGVKERWPQHHAAVRTISR